MFEFRRLYCAHAKLHAPFLFDGLLVMNMKFAGLTVQICLAL